ncbi:MAG TPA: DNA gyrase subunit A, partial [Planctomycetaceae bacterium]|nr:DNA gyrase subunit A [Planctomycetaceae bacterium]
MSDGSENDIVTSEGGRIRPLDIREEMQNSYLTYAMSVIISRALPDVRDGLKPSQRRILVAMNDLNLGPNAARKKCAKIAGDTSGNYHPHGEASVYPALVRMAQDWSMRRVLIDKQGNFGSLAGLPPAAMRYTEARLSAVAMEMLRDLDRNTVDFVQTYDQSNMEPVVLPSRFPNLLVNGSSGIAVGMATSIPPHNLGEVCNAVICLIDNPLATIDEIQEHLPAPDFPTGGVICGEMGTRQGYLTGRSTITLRAKTHFETEKNSDVIVVTEIPYMETRDRIREKLEHLVRDERIKGISRIVDLTDRNIPTWQVRLHIVLKKDADKEIVLNQLFQFSPLQTTVSMILLALVGNRPQVMPIKDILTEFILHRVDVIRRRTEFLLSEARKRKHTVEGLMIAQIDIDQVINTIRSSSSRNEAKDRLREINVPAELIARALGEAGFRVYQEEQGTKENYNLSANQAEAIVSMQLGALANLEREKLSEEHKQLLEDIAEHVLLLSDEANIRAVIRNDMEEIRDKYSDARRTEITDMELTDIDRGDLIAEEPMVVTLSQRGYIKRTPLSVYQAQNRGGKGIKGAKSDDEDPIEHLFVASTHAYLLFFTSNGKVHWQKVYDLPLQNRTAKGRAIVNVLAVDETTSIHNCLPVMEFDDKRFLMMATRKGVVKKTALSAYGRPQKGGIIAINLDDDDELIDVRIVSPGDDVVIGTKNGMSIRFSQADARPMGRNTRGVKGIKLSKDDEVVGMVIAYPEATLLSLCENGYGKRTPFGDIAEDEPEVTGEELPEDTAENDVAAEIEEGEGEEDTRSSMRYRRQRRGGKGLRDIRTTSRNGKVVDVLSVVEDDDILMVTAKGKIQRIHASDISVIGRNTQGVRVIRLDEDDKLVSTATIPAEILEDAELDLDIPVSEVPNNGNGNGTPATEEPTQPIEPTDDEAANEE